MRGGQNSINKTDSPFPSLIIFHPTTSFPSTLGFPFFPPLSFSPIHCQEWLPQNCQFSAAVLDASDSS